MTIENSFKNFFKHKISLPAESKLVSMFKIHTDYKL